MFLHRGRLATKIPPATPIGPKGSGETALPSLSAAPRNAGTFPRRCDVESSPSRLLEFSAVWPERWSRFGWYRPLETVKVGQLDDERSLAELAGNRIAAIFVNEVEIAERMMPPIESNIGAHLMRVGVVLNEGIDK